MILWCNQEQNTMRIVIIQNFKDIKHRNYRKISKIFNFYSLLSHLLKSYCNFVYRKNLENSSNVE